MHSALRPAAAAGALARPRFFSNFSNCSLLSHLSAPARQCKRAHALPAHAKTFQSANIAANAQIQEEKQHSFGRAQTKSTMLARLARRTRRTVRLLSDDASPAVPPQRIVVAVGGNALQRRGDRLTIENMLKAAKQMVPSILALRQAGHQVLLTHGNGPQVGELALERSAATFDVLGAESQGQIGYVLAQAFQSAGVDAACIVTQTAVDAGDKAFDNPTKYVGPVYGFKEAEALANQLDWTIKQDGEYYRRVVASPKPIAVLQLDAARTLLENNYPGLVVAGGGGGSGQSCFRGCRRCRGRRRQGRYRGADGSRTRGRRIHYFDGWRWDLAQFLGSLTEEK